MKTITVEFMQKIINEQGILDTKKYRYVAIDRETAKRMPVEYVGTTASIDCEWEEVTVR